ncbi:5-deoxy-glucuronate isomerase [Caldalkalibacillus uzonensis]|uniref:5-deoxy-glucuronate isomerase n=1 Tax=Caldalkalibacillus uzonensis TaxID=353224 RepID=A0ABU0CTA4_9BACI|nr:5-deoxy-glucuronate isomerase [Caldalkalibacillus uzonensis]MDQ0338267.1 5-deoxy-glucuronate isomerase [Caldalkalibacillus uzonensis]
MSRFHRARYVEGYQDIIPEEGILLKYLAFGKISLKQGQNYSSQTGNYETVLVIMTGTATIVSENKKWEHLGGRNTVFDGKGTAVYVPCQSEYKVYAESDVHIAVCKAKAEEKFEPFVVTPDEIVIHHRGKETWQREVHDIIADNADGRVQRIVLGETFNHPGHWSGYPPHKHDGEFFPEEPNLEEVYHFQVNPEQGFGVQLHYTKDGSIDNAYIVRQGDTFAIDKGYHPVAAAGGYQVYYLWFMAGNTGRTLNPYEDADHKWLHHKK